MKKAWFGTWANKCEYFARENSGFRIYNLPRVVLREWLQATKKCFKLGHSGTRGIPPAPLQHQVPRHWEIQISRWMRYNPDLRRAVDQGHGFEKGAQGASNAGKKRQQKPPSYPSYVSWTDQTYGPDGFYLISNGMELVWKLWCLFKSQKRCHNMPQLCRPQISHVFGRQSQVDHDNGSLHLHPPIKKTLVDQFQLFLGWKTFL